MALITDTPQTKSRELFERLERSLPGANTRTTTYYAPLPVALARGEGCRVQDLDGNEYIDLLNNYTSTIHGHGHPAIRAAIEAALEHGSVFPAGSVWQAELAERIRGRFPSIDLLRFTHSGTEAAMMAIRAARAHTGRDAIVKAIGGYHGCWEQVVPAAAEDELDASGEPLPLRGIPRSVTALTHAVRFNDAADLEATMTSHSGRVAAILLEPVLGHVIEPADPGFILAARRLADEHGALLVLDEVITARLHRGGMQSQIGVRPDLTVLAKIIGGGLPIGAFGGRAEIMRMFDPRLPEHIEHHGTHNGNMLAMAAGAAGLDLLTDAEIDRINELGQRLAAGLRDALEDAGTGLTVSSIGSLVNVRGAADDVARLHRAALALGVYMAPRGLLNISTPMDERTVDDALAILARAAAQVAAPR
jgi:glutamate-1-semialdehyde 2,1-aminomutase